MEKWRNQSRTLSSSLFNLTDYHVAADLHRLGNRFVTELRGCVIIVAELSADYKKECRMLENSPTDLERAEIKDIVGNQYYRLLRRQQDSKALPASKGTITADRGQENSRRLQNQLESNCFNWSKKDRRAGEYRSAKKTEKSADAAADKKGGGRNNCYVCGSEKHFAHKYCGLCKSLEHRIRDCMEREAERVAMLEKLNVPASSEVEPIAAMTRVAGRGRKEERESDSEATFHMYHTCAGMKAYK